MRRVCVACDSPHVATDPDFAGASPLQLFDSGALDRDPDAPPGQGVSPRREPIFKLSWASFPSAAAVAALEAEGEVVSDETKAFAARDETVRRLPCRSNWPSEADLSVGPCSASSYWAVYFRAIRPVSTFCSSRPTSRPQSRSHHLRAPTASPLRSELLSETRSPRRELSSTARSREPRSRTFSSCRAPARSSVAAQTPSRSSSSRVPCVLCR